MNEQSKAGPPASGGLFSDNAFPVASASTPPPAAPPKQERSQSTRLVLAVGLFVGAIMGIAWVAQYLPNWRAKPAAATAPPKVAPNAATGYLEFTQTRSVWDAEDDKYAREFERGQKGFYDYPFKSTADTTVELGVLRTSCDCSKVEIAVFPPADPNWEQYQKDRKPSRITDFPQAKALPWKAVPIDEYRGIDVPKGHIGIVRLSWEGKKADGEHLRLSLGLWAQPKGQQRARDFAVLETNVVVAPLLRFMQEVDGKIKPVERVSVGVLAAKDVVKTTLLCWSATRPKLNLSVNKEKLMAPYEFIVEPLSEVEAMNLEKKINDSAANTRVQAAFRVKAKIHESYLDQGPFSANLPLAIDGDAMEGGPIISGYVRGDVQIASSDSGKVELPTFLVKDGVRHLVPLAAEGNVDLTYESHQPAFLEVKLEKNAQESTPGRGRWNLEVRIPPGYAQPGAMPANSAVILRLSGPNPRVIRIPVHGNAVQG